MKVAILTDSLSDPAGTEYAAVVLACSLRGNGVDARIFCPEYNITSPWNSLLRRSGVRVVSYSKRITLKWSDINSKDLLSHFSDKLSATSRFVELYFRKWKPDVVHAIPFGLFATRWASMTGLSVPVIGSLLSVASESYPYYGDNLSESIQLCKGIMAPTRMVAQGVRNYLGFQGEIFVIPWVVMGPSHRIEYSGYPLSFGCVSRLSEEKGIEFLLASFRQIQNAMPSSELHIYGDGPERERVQRIAQILGLQRLSIERAFEPVYGMAKIASRHSVFLFPSLIESFGLASAEIMAFSRIPIMTDVGLAEYLPSTLRRRFVVSRGDASEMAKRALQIVKNSSRLEVFGLKFHDLWQNRFSPEAVVPHVVKMYGALTDRMK